MGNFYGLLGEKLGHSFSPIINDFLSKEIGLKGAYNLFEIDRENIQEALAAFKVLKCSGLNVTIPYKIDVIPYLDRLSEEAEKIGAVNTIKFSGKILEGYNTDYYGFGLTLKKYDVPVYGSKIVILGTGGVSKAVEKYLMDEGAGDIKYVSRNPQKFKQNGFEVLSYDDIENLSRCDVIINCTPCGMYPDVDKSAVDRKIIEKFDTAVDLIYNPQNTLFLKMASELGLKTVNGLYMLAAQNAASHNVWNDVNIDISVIDKVYAQISKSLGSDM